MSQTMNREYKSTVFAMLFSDKEKLKSLCEAVSGEKIDSAEDIEINTLSDEDGVQSGIFTKLKNDVSFIFHETLNLYEHQSTWSDNMPIRMLLYYADLIRKDHPLKTLYQSRAVPLPTPRFVVFYNGTDRQGDFDQMTLSLSGHFLKKEESPAVELQVIVYNINKGHNRKMMEACETMRQYSEFVSMSRIALAGLYTESEKTAAMEQVLDRCLKQGILVPFITEKREAIIMRYVWEYDEKAAMEAARDDGVEIGEEREAKKARLRDIQRILTSLDQGLSVETIAQVLMEPQETIAAMSRIREELGPDCSAEDVQEKLEKLTTVQ